MFYDIYVYIYIYMVIYIYIQSIHGVYKPTNITEGTHIVDVFLGYTLHL